MPKYKNTNNKNGYLAGLCVGLLGVCAIAFIGGVSKGFTNWDVKKWFENPVDGVTYYLEQAEGDLQDDPEFTIKQTLLMKSMADEEHEDRQDWFMFYDYDIKENQAFRVKIVTVKDSIEKVTYNTEDFTFGNIASNGSFVYYAGEEENIVWENAAQDLGNGLYYVLNANL